MQLIKEEEKGKHVIEQYFCIHGKEGLKMTAFVATIGTNPELKEPLEVIKNVLVSSDRTRTPFRL